MLGYIISDKETINVKKHKIQSFDILHKTNLNIFVVENNKILYKNNIMLYACRDGHVQVLEWFKNSGYEFKYNDNEIMWASLYGHVKILEWFINLFKNSGYKFNHGDAIFYASGAGHVQILKWFKNFGYKFEYDKSTIFFASKNGHDKILEFYKNYNVKKVIKWSKPLKFIKTIKYKTKNNYIKGYNKN